MKDYAKIPKLEEDDFGDYWTGLVTGLCAGFLIGVILGGVL